MKSRPYLGVVTVITSVLLDKYRSKIMEDKDIKIIQFFLIEYFIKELKKFILHVTMFVLYYDLLQVFIKMKSHQKYNNDQHKHFKHFQV